MTASLDERAVPARSSRRVPDFFIVGHPKSGTTALYEMLRRHPQVFMPGVKEPRFLASDMRALVPSTPNQPATLEQYLALFAQAQPQQRVGEASSSYLRSRAAAGAIAQLQPGARIIAIFREPASFVRSLHLQLLQEHVEDEPDLATALEREARVRNGQQLLRYSDHVRYAEQLRRFHAAFPREQVLALVYDDFRADNRATLERVLRFLGVDAQAELPVFEANPSVALRAPRLDAAVRGLARGRGWLPQAARSVLPRAARRRALALLRRNVLYERPAAPDAEVMLALRRRYRDEVAAFSDYLGRDLVSFWGYDGLP